MRDYIDLKRTMWIVIVALVPCLLWSFYNTGYQHFHALASMAGDGGAAAYTVGWMQALLFGSDYPYMPPERWLQEFAELEIRDEARDLILLENAKTVLGL